VTISLEEMITAVRRELALRKNVYRRRVAEGRMNPEEAAREYATMLAVMLTLRDVLEGGVAVAKEVKPEDFTLPEPDPRRVEPDPRRADRLTQLEHKLDILERTVSTFIKAYADQVK